MAPVQTDHVGQTWAWHWFLSLPVVPGHSEVLRWAPGSEHSGLACFPTCGLWSLCMPPAYLEAGPREVTTLTDPTCWGLCEVLLDSCF